jgi:hypothetical protein
MPGAAKPQNFWRPSLPCTLAVTWTSSAVAAVVESTLDIPQPRTYVTPPPPEGARRAARRGFHAVRRPLMEPRQGRRERSEPRGVTEVSLQPARRSPHHMHLRLLIRAHLPDYEDTGGSIRSARARSCSALTSGRAAFYPPLGNCTT